MLVNLYIFYVKYTSARIITYTSVVFMVKINKVKMTKKLLRMYTLGLKMTKKSLSIPKKQKNI